MKLKNICLHGVYELKDGYKRHGYEAIEYIEPQFYVLPKGTQVLVKSIDSTPEATFDVYVYAVGKGINQWIPSQWLRRVRDNPEQLPQI